MFASYHFSHPILTERLKALEWESGKPLTSEVRDEKGTFAEVAAAAKTTGREEL
jgi:STE24 endopeptidase